MARSNGRKGMKALVTGGNKGIGLEVTQQLLDADVEVTVLARNFDVFNLKAHQLKFDLTNVTDIPSLIGGLEPFDVLINNSGFLYALSPEDYSPEQRAEMFRINLEAPLVLATEVGRSMKTKGAGRIVNNASIAGHIGHPDIWYGATKAGLLNATKSLARLFGPYGVIVNAVAPGPIDTEMLSIVPEERKQGLKSQTVLRRFGRADEVAKTICWLALEAPEYINGVTIDINGGAYYR